MIDRCTERWFEGVYVACTSETLAAVSTREVRLLGRALPCSSS